MSDPDFLAGLGEPVIRPPFLAYLDILGDPIRATTWEVSLQPQDTGDTDLDGFVFSAVSPTVASVDAVVLQTGGSDSVTVSLSGIVGPDSDLLDVLGDPTKWKGRLARLWLLLLAEDGGRIGGVSPFYTGRMVDFGVKGSGTAQTAIITIETYLASYTSASNRSYMDQVQFDPTDVSAGLTLAVANGSKTGTPATSTTAPVNYTQFQRLLA